MSGRVGRREAQGDDVARGLHELANSLHGMTLRLTVLRRDPQCVARQATTLDALGAALADAAETVARLHQRVAEQRGGDTGRRRGTLRRVERAR